MGAFRSFPNPDILAWLARGLSQPGRTQRGLASALGVDPAIVSRMMQGKRRLRVNEITAAARYFGIAPPPGFTPERDPSTPDFIDLPPDLRIAVFAKAMDMSIEPEEFLVRAVRAALVIVGPRPGGERY